MPLTFQILSWHRIYKGKTKELKNKISTTSKQNHQFISYRVKKETDTKRRDHAH